MAGMEERAVTIYALVDPRTAEVRYVGKTISLPRRYVQHLKANGKTHRDYWIRSLRSIGMVPTMVMIEVVREDDWAARERYWIAWYRERGARLCNVLSGGQGGGHKASPAEKAKLIARWSDPAYKARVSEKLKMHNASESVREQRRQASLQAYAKPEVLAKITRANREMANRPEVLEKQRARMLARYSDPSERVTTGEKTRRFFEENPERRADVSKAVKSRYADPEFHEHHREAVRAAQFRPEIRDPKILRMKARYDDPAERVAQSARMKAVFAALWADPVWKAKTLAERARKKAERERGD